MYSLSSGGGAPDLMSSQGEKRMVYITCMCGHTGDCSCFIPPNIINVVRGKKTVVVQNFYKCPACLVKFRGPKNGSEIGVQILKDYKKVDMGLRDRIDQEIAEFKRELYLKRLGIRPRQQQLIEAL